MDIPAANNADVTESIARQQAALEAQPPATKHAAAAVVLLGVHEGDDFPLPQPAGLGGARFAQAADLEAQASEAILNSTFPDGHVSPIATKMAAGFREEAMQLRRLARREETAAAIVAAIDEEPQAWSTGGGYLRSESVWIWLGEGPKCLEFGHRYLAGDGEYTCSSEGTDAQDAIWNAANRWKMARSPNNAASINAPSDVGAGK